MSSSSEITSSAKAAVRAGKNSAFLLTSQIVTKLAAFAGVVLLARILEVSDFGVLSLALAVTGIVSLFVELGLDQLSIREIARDHASVPDYFTNAALLKLVLAAIAILVTFLILRFSGLAAGSGTIILILTAGMVPNSVYHLLISMFMGLERMAYVAVINVLAEITRLVLMALVLLSGYGLVAVAWSYVAAITMVSLVTLFVVRQVVSNLLKPPSVRVMIAMVRESLPFMFLGLFFIIYFKIDFIMLAWMKDETMVGSYAAAYRLMESLLFVPAAFMGAVYPALSRISSTGKDSVLQAARKTLRYMAMIGIPIGFGTTVLAERIILFLFGPAYIESVLPLQIIIWAMVLIFINCVCPVGLNAVNRQMLSVLVTGVGIVVNVTLNLVLIPGYGATGTSIATTVTEIVTTAMLLVLFSGNIGRLRLMPVIYKPLLAGGFMAACLLLLSFLPLAVLILAGVASYIIAMMLLGAFGRADYELVRAISRPGLTRQNGS